MSRYNSQLVKLLLTSIDDVEMRRLKEGFYGIMKLSNQIKDKPDYKAQLIDFSKNKIEKPQSEAIIQLPSIQNEEGGVIQVEDINIGVDLNANLNAIPSTSQGFVRRNLTLNGGVQTNNDSETLNSNSAITSDQLSENPDQTATVQVAVEEEKKQPSYQPGKQRAKQKGKKSMAVNSFARRLQLRVGGGDGEEEKDDDLPPSLQQQQIQVQEEQKQEDQQVIQEQIQIQNTSHIEQIQPKLEDISRNIENNFNQIIDNSDEISQQLIEKQDFNQYLEQNNISKLEELIEQQDFQYVDLQTQNLDNLMPTDIDQKNFQEVIFEPFPQNRYTYLEQKTLILVNLLQTILRRKPMLKGFAQLSKFNNQIGNSKESKYNLGLQKIAKVLQSSKERFLNEFMIKMKALQIISYEDNPCIMNDNQLGMQDKKKIKIITILNKHQSNQKLNFGYFFKLWHAHTKLTNFPNKPSDNFEINQKEKDQQFTLKSATFNLLAYNQSEDSNKMRQDNGFNDKNTGVLKLYNVLEDIRIKQVRQGFEEIQNNSHYHIQNYFESIKSNLSNLEDYIKVIGQNESEQEQDRESISPDNDNQQYLRYLKSLLFEAKSLYSLYGKIIEQKQTEQTLRTVEYDPSQLSSKLKSVVKIFQICNNKSFVEKSVLRRLRIWHSRGLREEMRILCNSLSKCQKQEKKINLIILMQFQKVRLQYFYYLWLENMNFDKSQHPRSIRSAYQNSSLNIRSTSSNGGVNKRITPSSFSIDETQSKTRGGFIQQSNKRQQQKLMMGSFDLDSQKAQQNPNLSSLKGNKPNQTRMTSYGSINNSNISGNISQSNIKHTLITQSPAIYNTVDRQHLNDIKAKSLFKLSKILIERSSQTQLSNYIRTITNISNQSAKYKKAIMLSQEVQNIIAESCKFIFQIVFRKWVIVAHHRGRQILDRQQGITKLFSVLHRKQRLSAYDSLLKIHKYKIHIQKQAGDLNTKTQYIQKLSNVKVAHFIIHKITSRFGYKSLIKAFQKWKFIQAFSNQRQSILEQSFNSINRSLSEVFTPKRQNGSKLPYEDPLMKDRLKKLSEISSAVQISNILERPSLVRELNVNLDKMELYKFFQKWLNYTANNRPHNQLQSKLKSLNDSKLKIYKRIHRQLSLTANRKYNQAFQKWKLQSNLQQSGQDSKIVEQVDQSIIQVQAQVGSDLERQLLKQSEQVRIIKNDKIITRIIDIYQDNMQINNRVKKYFNQWAKNSGVIMDFGRVSKYLQEIDISINEKQDLEMRVQQTQCETCRQLMNNKAMMIVQQQNERRSQVWDMYSQNQESEVRRIDDDGENGSNWNESSYDNIRRLTSDGGNGSSRNLTGRSARIISNRHLNQQQASTKHVQQKMQLEIQNMDESNDDTFNNNDVRVINSGSQTQHDDSDMQSSIVMRMESGQDGDSMPNSSKNASIRFFGGDNSQLNSSSQQNLFNHMLGANMQRPRVSTQIRRIYQYPENPLIEGQEEQEPSQSNASGSTQMIKIDNQSTFSMNTVSQNNKNSNNLYNNQMSAIKSDDSKSQFSRQSFKSHFPIGGHVIMNPTQNQYLKDLSIMSGGNSSSDQQQLLNANQHQQNILAALNRQATSSNNGTSSHGDTTEMRRMSSYQTFSDINVPSNGVSFINDNINQLGNRNLNRRFSRYSDTGTVIEEADPEQFGNDLNCELRIREEQLKIQLQKKIADHQVKKEQMLRKIRELEEKRNLLKGVGIVNAHHYNQVSKDDISQGSQHSHSGVFLEEGNHGYFNQQQQQFNSDAHSVTSN
eukprot:403360422